MELCIFDKNRQLTGIIEAFEHLYWTRRYSRCGSFKLKVIASDENLALLQIGNILWKNDDDEAGLIEFVELTMHEQEFLEVSGRFATSFLARRIIWGNEILSGDLGMVMGKLLNAHLINPSDSARQITGITYTPVILGVTVNTQISYKNLMEAVTDFCDVADVGIKTVFDPKMGILSILPYWGLDSNAVFSKEYENIIDQVFIKSVVDYASLAIVGSEKEDVSGTLVTVGNGFGENRYEIFVDAKDLHAKDFPDNYTNALIFRGHQKLTELAMIQAFDATINQYGNLTYKIDFDIGNKVRVVSGRWGVSLNTRITVIEERYNSEGMNLSVTFGKPLLTLA